MVIVLTLLELENISKSFGATRVLKDISWQLNSQDKIGLVGDNGSGKSTLMKIMDGQLQSDKGILRTAQGTTVSYLQQNPTFDEQLTLSQLLEGDFKELLKVREQMKALETKMSDANVSDEELAKIIAKYGQLQDEFQMRGGNTYEAHRETVLNRLELSSLAPNLPVSSLSGGQKARVELARILLRQHEDSRLNLLLLDEPDNHLDMASIDWLQQFLKEYRGAFVLVSHNRFLLDQVVDEIVELEDAQLTKYHGNYSYYTKDKERRMRSRYYAHINQKRRIDNLRKSIMLLKKWSSRDSVKRARQAKSMERKLERMDVVEKPNFQRKKMKLDFEVEQRSGEMVVEAVDLTKRYGEMTLFDNANFTIRWGEHIALVGPNASGKSTLIRLILGLEQPTSGTIKLGEGLIVSYFDQTQKGLNPERTIYDEVQSGTELTVCDTRYLLAHLAFPQDEAFKQIKNLSGGERNRVMLSKLVYSKANFLVLDEPTNHLDIASVEVLEEALAEFPGTILLASHDKYLLTRVADRVIEVDNGKVRYFPGGYDK